MSVSDTAEQPSSPTSLKRGILSVVTTFGIAITTSLCILLFVFQSYEVSGESMQPTLQDNDRLLVWKLPSTLAHITGSTYVPNRGDIVIVNQPDLSACGQEGKVIIKRVLGLPGEKIVVSRDAITVHNTDNPEGFQPDKSLAYGKAFAATFNRPETITLDDNQVFVAGDNRDHSCDSRAVGPIATDDIVGKLLLRVAPLSDAKPF